MTKKKGEAGPRRIGMGSSKPDTFENIVDAMLQKPPGWKPSSKKQKPKKK